MTCDVHFDRSLKDLIALSQMRPVTGPGKFILSDEISLDKFGERRGRNIAEV